MGRSAISRSMKKRVSGTHVSGLASSKPSGKRSKDNVIKFGSLTRKQQQDLKEYGELIPRDFIDDEEEEGGKPKKLRRVVREEDLDRELEGRVESDEEDDAESAAAKEEEENDWQKPSAYSRLVGSLQKTSKNREFYERIRREQLGLEDQVMEEDDDDDEMKEEEHDLDQDDNLAHNQVDENEQDNENEENESAEEPKEEAELNEQEAAAEGGEAEGDEEGVRVDYVSSEDEEGAEVDPFVQHFADPQPKEFEEQIARVEQKKWDTEAFEDDIFGNVLSYSVGRINGSIRKGPRIKDLTQTFVKSRVARQWKKTNSNCVPRKYARLFTGLQDRLFQHMIDYRDILYCNRNIKNAEEIRNAYVLHAYNHIQKTGDRIMRHNEKLERAQEQNKDIGEIRDQGFTRPKVLIVLPFRNTVVDVVNKLIKLSGREQQENKKRFYDEFGLKEQDVMDESKPADFKDTFRGNIDDHFRLSIKFTKKTMKFYSRYYASDMFIVSPLGLRTLIGNKNDDEGGGYDLLSSIEVVIFDQMHHMLMQNWEHVELIFKHLNLIPKDTHGCDISRIKTWYLDKKAPYLRQTLLFADFLSPEINAVFGKYCKNVAGKLKIKPNYDEGTIVDVHVRVPQTFTRIDATSIAAMDDTRFKYFIEKTLPSLRKSAVMQKHTLIFIPSYFDFVRVRNYLEDNAYSYLPLSEYTDGRGISHARTMFFQGRTDFLLYTERAHFFRRYNIRGTFHVVFYGLPDHPQFYPEIVNFLGLKFNEASAAEEATFSCTALFSKYDQLKLERIVGTERAYKMCTAQRNVFTFA